MPTAVWRIAAVPASKTCCSSASNLLYSSAVGRWHWLLARSVRNRTVPGPILPVASIDKSTTEGPYRVSMRDSAVRSERAGSLALRACSRASIVAAVDTTTSKIILVPYLEATTSPLPRFVLACPRLLVFWLLPSPERGSGALRRGHPPRIKPCECSLNPAAGRKFSFPCSRADKLPPPLLRRNLALAEGGGIASQCATDPLPMPDPQGKPLGPMYSPKRSTDR